MLSLFLTEKYDFIALIVLYEHIEGCVSFALCLWVLCWGCFSFDSRFFRSRSSVFYHGRFLFRFFSFFSLVICFVDWMCFFYYYYEPFFLLSCRVPFGYFLYLSGLKTLPWSAGCSGIQCQFRYLKSTSLSSLGNH